MTTEIELAFKHAYIEGVRDSGGTLNMHEMILSWKEYQRRHKIQPQNDQKVETAFKAGLLRGFEIGNVVPADGTMTREWQSFSGLPRATDRAFAEADYIPGIKSKTGEVTDEDAEKACGDAIFEDAKQSSDLYARMAAKMVEGLEEAGMREQHRQRNRERSAAVDAMNAPYGKQSERTIADVVRERGIEALFSSADYTTRQNAERFREGLIKFMPPDMTLWSQLMHDAVILLLERVK